ITVNQPSTATTLASTSNPALAGQKVTLVATTSSSAGTPTGVVNFYDGTVLLGSANLSSGRASLSAVGLARGTHSLRAVYGGSAPYPSSASATLSQVIYGLTAAGIAPALSAQLGTPLNSVLVATFADDDPSPALHHYTATIVWGDGATSAGVVSATGASSF